MKLDEQKIARKLASWLERSVLPLLREGSLTADNVANEMVRELSALSRVDREQNVIAPDQFTLTIHPHSALVLRGHMPEIHASLSKSLEHQLRDLGFTLRRRVHVTLATDPTVSGGEAMVIAWHSADPLKITKELTPVEDEPGREAPGGAFLMVDGRSHYELVKSETTIGRLLENDVVLDDPHISRRHARIVLEAPSYVIYDRNSTAGTFVNGTRVSGHRLRPGDVITIAGIDIVYGESQAGPPGEARSYTPPPASPPDSHRITPLDLKTIEIPTKSFSPLESKDEEESGDDGTK